MTILYIALLIFSVAFTVYLAGELKDYTTKDRGWNGFFLAVTIDNIFTCIGKLA